MSNLDEVGIKMKKTEKKVYFLVVYEAEEGGYWGCFPDFDCCADQGETLEALIDNAKCVLTELVAAMVESGDALPEALDGKDIKAKADPDNGEIAFVVPVTVYPPAKTERFNLTTTGDKLAMIDDYARRNHISRSELMVSATLKAIEA